MTKKLFFGSPIALLVVFFGAICIGQVNYVPWHISTMLSDPLEWDIFMSLRVPRAVFALLVGFALSLAGVGTQGIFKNSLADPYVLGISGGAAVGAAAAIAFGETNLQFLIVACAFLGSLVVSAGLIVLTRAEKWSTHTVLLVGIAVNLFCGSVLSVIMFSADKQTTNIVLWLMGNLGHIDWSQLMIVGGLIFAGSVVLFPQAKHLDVHLLGDETATALGSNLESYRTKTIIAVCLLVSAAVCFCGAIGFVGLVIPHAVRLLIGPRHLPLMCIAPIMGATFLILCDTTARTIILPQSLPVGVVTGLIGGPVFVYLLFKEKT